MSGRSECRQLDRAPEPFKGKVPYRDFRRRSLDGPIAELERPYGDEAAA